jgi:beta-galactosidase
MFDFGADARGEGGENGQNHKGLVTFDRKYKKDAFYAYKAWLSDEPFVHIAGKRYVYRECDPTVVTVYSNLPEGELFANGKSVGKKKSDDRFFRFEVKNCGETHLVAVAEGCRDESKYIKVEKFHDDYRLKEKGALLNWFDITERDGYLSLNSKISDIIATEGGKVIFEGILRGAKNEGSFELNEGMMAMMGGFTLVRFAAMAEMVGIKLTKEELLNINAKLNGIKKA